MKKLLFLFVALFMLVGCISTQQFTREITAAPTEEKEFAITQLAFCSEPPEDLGVYQKKANNKYQIDDELMLYIEFRGISEIILNDDLKEAWLIQYITIMDPDGIEKLSLEAINSHPMNIPVNISIDPSWLWNYIPVTADYTLGEYAIIIQIIDNLNGNTDMKEIKFVVVK